MERKENHIRRRILTPIAIAFLAVFVAGIVVFIITQRTQLERNTLQKLDGLSGSLEDLLTEDGKTLNGLLAILEADENLLQPWLLRDRDMLYARAVQLFDTLNMNNRVTHFYFLEPDGHCFLRVHEPERYGDTIQRFTFEHAANTKRTAQGIELGPLGTFTMRVVAPWRVDGELVGYIELGEEIEHITPRLKETLGADLVFTIDKKFLNREEWEQRASEEKPSRDWNQFTDVVLIDTSMDEIPGNLTDTFNVDHSDAKMDLIQLETDEVRYHGGFVPLVDAGNQNVGRILLLRNVTSEFFEARLSLATFIGFVVLTAMLLIFGFYRYLGRIQTRLDDGQIELENHRVHLEDLVRERTSELEKTQSQLLNSQKMESVGQLAGGIAHDFNNLLQVILGYGDMAKTEVPPDAPISEHIEQMMLAGDRAKDLVSQLLAFSRRQVLELSNLELDSVIADLRSIIQSVIGENITLELIAAEKSGVIRADRGQIEQIVLNLCINARDAIPGHGTLTIKTEIVELDEEFCLANPGVEAGGYVKLSVADTGCGMSEQTRQRAFEPFFTTKPAGKGTGLGLATVFGIVHQHEGILEIESELEVGTTFKLYFPMIEGEMSAVVPAEVGFTTGGNETILLADDDDMVLRITETILKQSGYTVLTAQDGQEAVAVFDEFEKQIDIAVLDLVMPKLGGKGVYEHIQNRHPRFPVIFASGYSQDGIHSNFVLDAGMQLIQKPYKKELLLQRIRMMLEVGKAPINNESTYSP
jgi:signal transduction histidine kinase